jgi:hypothetical protein
MNCPKVDEIILHLDGELSVNRSRELESHLRECSVCAGVLGELERVVRRIAPDEGEFDEPDLAQKIVTRAREGRLVARSPRRPWRRWAAAGGAVALAAAAAVLLAVWLPGMDRAPDSGGFRARGGSDQAGERWLSFWVFRKADDGGYVEVRRGASGGARRDNTVSAEEHLAFAYLDARGSYRHLMILAVDEDGRVFWYYPAYEREGTDPHSIAIQRGKHELRDEIRHRLRPGKLRVFAIFSRDPLRVSLVERTVAALGKRHGGAAGLERLPLAGTRQISRVVEVVR